MAYLNTNQSKGKRTVKVPFQGRRQNFLLAFLGVAVTAFLAGSPSPLLAETSTIPYRPILVLEEVKAPVAPDTSSIPRKQLKIPVIPNIEDWKPGVTDNILLETAGGNPVAKLYIPRYRLKTETLADGKVQYAATLEQNKVGQEWTFTVHFESYPAEELGEKPRDAYPWETKESTVTLMYRKPNAPADTHIRFQDLTFGQTGGLVATLRVKTLDEATELQNALTATNPTWQPRIVINRSLQVGVPRRVDPTVQRQLQTEINTLRELNASVKIQQALPGPGCAKGKFLVIGPGKSIGTDRRRAAELFLSSEPERWAGPGKCCLQYQFLIKMEYGAPRFTNTIYLSQDLQVLGYDPMQESLTLTNYRTHSPDPQNDEMAFWDAGDRDCFAVFQFTDSGGAGRGGPFLFQPQYLHLRNLYMPFRFCDLDNPKPGSATTFGCNPNVNYDGAWYVYADRLQEGSSQVRDNLIREKEQELASLGNRFVPQVVNLPWTIDLNLQHENYVFEKVNRGSVGIVPIKLGNSVYYQDTKDRTHFYYLPDSFGLKIETPSGEERPALHIEMLPENGFEVTYIAEPKVDRARLEKAKIELSQKAAGGPLTLEAFEGKDPRLTLVLPKKGNPDGRVAETRNIPSFLNLSGEFTDTFRVTSVEELDRLINAITLNDSNLLTGHVKFEFSAGNTENEETIPFKIRIPLKCENGDCSEARNSLVDLIYNPNVQTSFRRTVIVEVVAKALIDSKVKQIDVKFQKDNQSMGSVTLTPEQPKGQVVVHQRLERYLQHKPDSGNYKYLAIIQCQNETTQKGEWKGTTDEVLRIGGKAEDSLMATCAPSPSDANK